MKNNIVNEKEDAACSLLVLLVHGTVAETVKLCSMGHLLACSSSPDQNCFKVFSSLAVPLLRSMGKSTNSQAPTKNLGENLKVETKKPMKTMKKETGKFV